MSSKKEVFENLRDLFGKNTLIARAEQGKSDDELDYKYLRKSLYNALKDTNTLDPDYLDNSRKFLAKWHMLNGLGYTLLVYLDEHDSPLQECYTALTFVMRADKVPGLEDMFEDYVDGGLIYRALIRVCKLLK